MAVSNIFATQAAGPVPASYLDVDFTECALLSAANVFANTQNITPASGDAGLVITLTGGADVKAISIIQDATGTASVPELNKILIQSDNINAGTDFCSGLVIAHHFGGAATHGGREAFAAYAVLDATTATSGVGNNNHQYVGVTGVAEADANDTGTDPSAANTSVGAFFGAGFVGVAKNGATALSNVTGVESNIAMQTGSSVFAKSIAQFSGRTDDAVQGSGVDAMLWCYNQANVVKFTDGLRFDNSGGVGFFPFDTNSYGIRFTGGGGDTIGTLLEASGITISTNIINVPNFKVTAAGGITAGGALFQTSGDTGLEIKTTGVGAGDWDVQTLAADGSFRIFDAASVVVGLSIAKSTGEVTFAAGSAWTSYTPTITSGTGAITTKSATGRYRTINKTVFFEAEITITTNGTGATSVNATLPFTSANAKYVVAGREYASTGKMLQGLINNSGTMQIYNYDNTYPGADGFGLALSGTYERA